MMKYYILLVAFFSFTAATGQSSSANYKIDPRQYITIYETNGTRINREPIWYMVKKNVAINTDETADSVSKNKQTEFFPFQKHFIVGENSLLEIYFNQDSLAKNVNFYGGISLIATVGERKIEINPYYVIGENQETYGVKSMPIREIADYFLRMMIESSKAQANYDNFLKTYEDEAVEFQVVKDAIDETTRFLARVRGTNPPTSIVDFNSPYFFSFRRKLEETLNLLNENNPYLEQLNTMAKRPELFSYDAIIRTLNDCKTDLKSSNVNIDRATVTNIQLNKLYSDVNKKATRKKAEEHYKSFYNSALRVQKLIGAINQGDIDASDKTLKAFLNLTLLTISDFNTINNDLNLGLSKLKEYPNLQDILNKQLPVELANIYSSISELNKGGIELVEILKKYGYNQMFIKPKVSNLEDSLLYNIPVDYKKVRNELAEKAGREIFRDLIMGTIDIRKSDIRDGDIVDISVIWDSKKNDDESKSNNSKSESTNSSQKNKLPLTSFLVKKIGWHLDVSESALLIHRIDEEKLQSGYPISPSNFKPTAGANLLWSYYNPYRTATHIKRSGRNKGQIKEYGFLNFLHWLEPSFGINVSYLDFRTDRDFEFGAGPIMGLFQNRIFLTTGYNFSVNGESPFYMGIGFSFSNIYKRINKADND